MMMKRPHCGNDNYDYVSRHASQRSGRWTWKYIHPLKSPIPPPPELNTCILCYLCSHNSSHKARWYFSWGDPGTGSPRHTSGTSRASLGHWSHTLTLLGARQDLKWFIALSLFFLKNVKCHTSTFHPNCPNVCRYSAQSHVSKRAFCEIVINYNILVQVLGYIQKSFALWQNIGELSFREVKYPTLSHRPIPLDISKEKAHTIANSHEHKSLNIDINFFFVK